MRSDIVPGGIFPDYGRSAQAQRAQRATRRRSANPYACAQALIAQRSTSSIWNSPLYPKVAVAHTQIATDDHHPLQEFRASAGAEWTFLSDPNRTIQKDLDIQEYTDPEHNPMIAHTLVLKPGMVICSIYHGYWFWGHPSVIDLGHDLRVVTSEIRPDRDLSALGLREAWNAGDFSRFHRLDQHASVEAARIARKKGHGLVERDASRYAYRITTTSVQVALLFLFFHKRLCGPLANSRFHHTPDPAHAPQSKLEAAYHKADKAIQNIVDLLAVA
jgi:hypothetical protein